MLLNHFQAPVIPVSIHGTYESMPRGKALVRLAKVTLVFGEPLDVYALVEQQGEDRHEDQILQTLRDRVTKLGDRP